MVEVPNGCCTNSKCPIAAFYQLVADTGSKKEDESV